MSVSTDAYDTLDDVERDYLARRLMGLGEGVAIPRQAWTVSEVLKRLSEIFTDGIGRAVRIEALITEISPPEHITVQGVVEAPTSSHLQGAPFLPAWNAQTAAEARESTCTGTELVDGVLRYPGLFREDGLIKPFTPNKYTRYIPTLDGRCVPVDVYCVSEAFPLADCLKSQGAVDAVNHARKKLLAPGQRGTKSSIQDIKEAHASLGRAIEIEEAALGREPS